MVLLPLRDVVASCLEARRSRCSSARARWRRRHQALLVLLALPMQKLVLGRLIVGPPLPREAQLLRRVFAGQLATGDGGGGRAIAWHEGAAEAQVAG